MTRPEKAPGGLTSLRGVPEGDRIGFVGHSTVEIALDGMSVLTDPFLRTRVGPLVRRPPPVDASALRPDAVLISHLDRDHLDVPSVRALPGKPRLVVPAGAADFVRGKRFEDVTELAAGESTEVGPLTVRAVPATHGDWRGPFGPRADPVGYVVSGSRTVYFAGDTDLFDEMEGLAPGLDVALLPVTGWGRTIGEGHLDPERAAQALGMLRPRIAVPIHWGTIHPMWFGRQRRRELSEPAREFAELAARFAPEVEVRILEPGESLELGAQPGSGGGAP
jgi:L-ascorbate metabolism protein UlaG (beta-lactamase superfamily)